MIKDYIARKEHGRELSFKHQLIRENFLSSYNDLVSKKVNALSVIKRHKKFINLLELNLKKPHPNLLALQHYINTKDKTHALANLTQYVNNRSMFS